MVKKLKVCGKEMIDAWLVNNMAKNWCTRSKKGVRNDWMHVVQLRIYFRLVVNRMPIREFLFYETYLYNARFAVLIILIAEWGITYMSTMHVLL